MKWSKDIEEWKEIFSLDNTKWKKVSFEEMIKCDEISVKCEHPILKKLKVEYGVDLEKGMLFNEFIEFIGAWATPKDCKLLFKDAEWYVIDKNNIISKITKKLKPNR